MKCFGNNGFIKQPAQFEFNSRKGDRDGKGFGECLSSGRDSVRGGEEGRAKCVVLLHCVEGHSSRIDAHGKGGVSTFIVTKTSYCLFTRTDTKGVRKDNGAFVCTCARICERVQM